ncbi:unnamed protein product [Closterium sp. Naga37s-1]|nr:unnamed protein product [Closterium sp. Naga37s-1]
MASLAALDLAVNRLSGPIPPTLATLPMLKFPLLCLSVSLFLAPSPPSTRPTRPPFLLNTESAHSRFFCLLSRLSYPSSCPTQFLTFLNPKSAFSLLFLPTFPLSLPTPQRTFSSHLLPGPSRPHHHSQPYIFFCSTHLPTFLPLLSLLHVPRAFVSSAVPPSARPTMPLPSSTLSPIPAFCQEGQLLSFLNLASNSLSGPPTPLSSPSCSDSLQFLSLPANSLSGPIPATISSFTNLKRLRLDKNSLTGAIPAGEGECATGGSSRVDKLSQQLLSQQLEAYALPPPLSHLLTFTRMVLCMALKGKYPHKVVTSSIMPRHSNLLHKTQPDTVTCSGIVPLRDVLSQSGFSASAAFYSFHPTAVFLPDKCAPETLLHAEALGRLRSGV